MHVHAKIQKWGNGLALRIAGVLRDIPHFEEGSQVDIEVNENGFILKKSESSKKKSLPFSESELLKDITPMSAHADELFDLLPSEKHE